MVYKVCKECETCNNYKVCENGCFGNTKPCEHLSTDAELDFLYYTVDEKKPKKKTVIGMMKKQ